MWLLTLRSPSTGPIDYELKPGINTLGRKPDNDIVIADESASRNHAELFCQEDSLVINDLDSTNGTFVNRERITGPRVLRSNDQIRIGNHNAIVTYQEENGSSSLIAAFKGTRPLTRDFLLEAIDQHSVLLFEVSNQLTKILDLKTAIQEIAKLMRLSMGAEKGEVILADQFDRLSELGFPTTIAREAIDKRSVVIIPDLTALESRPLSQTASLLKIRSVLCVPVIIESEVVALIYAYKTDPSARPFDQNDLQIAVAISNQTALTIQRANLVEQKVNFDSLTGLYNRNIFLEMAENEFQRAMRFKHLTTIMMLDIDEFKEVNDTYGHIVGDQVLRNVALCCRRQIREIDLLGRYGGDEFIFMLAETDTLEGKNIAERIRQQIAETSFETEHGPLSITVSLGVATLSEDCPDLTTLINCADDALYLAKKAGKNQVEIRK
jgi:diguanylate cyclase (GGDEF)-like protein